MKGSVNFQGTPLHVLMKPKPLGKACLDLDIAKMNCPIQHFSLRGMLESVGARRDFVVQPLALPSTIGDCRLRPLY